MYKLHQLLTFQAVHRSGSFAVAARELDYTPSAVSQQIAALEKSTGLVLFEREPHGVRTTAAAHLFAELARRLLASTDDFDYQVRQLARGLSGRVRLGSVPTAGVRLLPAILSGFRRDHPGIEITLEESEPEELLDQLVDGDLDVTLVYEYGLCPRQWPDDVTTLPLLREDLLLLRAAEQPGAMELSRLADELWITSREGTGGAQSLGRLCAAVGFTPTIAFRSNNYDVVRELVVATGGVAVVPALCHVPDERISAVPLTQGSAYRTVCVAYRTNSSNPMLTEFLAATRRAVPSQTEHLTPLV